MKVREINKTLKLLLLTALRSHEILHNNSVSMSLLILISTLTHSHAKWRFKDVDNVNEMNLIDVEL